MKNEEVNAGLHSWVLSFEYEESISVRIFHYFDLQIRGKGLVGEGWADVGVDWELIVVANS